MDGKTPVFIGLSTIIALLTLLFITWTTIDSKLAAVRDDCTKQIEAGQRFDDQARQRLRDEMIRNIDSTRSDIKDLTDQVRKLVEQFADMRTDIKELFVGRPLPGPSRR